MVTARDAGGVGSLLCSLMPVVHRLTSRGRSVCAQSTADKTEWPSAASGLEHWTWGVALDKVRGVSPVLRAQLQGVFRTQALLWVEAALGPGTGLSWGQFWFCY